MLIICRYSNEQLFEHKMNSYLKWYINNYKYFNKYYILEHIS